MADSPDDTLFRDLDDIVASGAAADAADGETEIGLLPRTLRMAVIGLRMTDARDRLAADIVSMVPELGPAAAEWAEHGTRWKSLAVKLDQVAAANDRPALRALADAVRLLTMTRKDVEKSRADALRVLAGIEMAADEARRQDANLKFLSFAETFQVGWVMLMHGRREKRRYVGMSALSEAMILGKHATTFVRDAVLAEHEKAEAERERRRVEAEANKTAKQQKSEAGDSAVAEGFVRVCPPIEAKVGKARDAIRGHEHVIGVALPLAPVPDLARVRTQLIFEFPYAIDQIDRLLAPLIGKRHVHLPPTLIVGSPGTGKSRLCRRLAEVLGVSLWRTDGARADGSTFGGTDRRWYTSEPCHAFLAISRARIANPAVLIDEIEKAATRSAHGRLWDALLAVLEPETAAAYPDPCLQVDIDVSNVTVIATANTLQPLPSPLLDRFRVVEMPEPRATDLQRLIPPLIADAAAEQGVDARWFEPLTTDELAVLRSRWQGGSVRRLRAYLGVLLRARDRGRSVN